MIHNIICILISRRSSLLGNMTMLNVYHLLNNIWWIVHLTLKMRSRLLHQGRNKNLICLGQKDMIIISFLHNSNVNYNTGERYVEHLPNNQLQFCKNTINHSYLYLNICQHISQGLNCSHLKVITFIIGWHRFRIKVRGYCKMKISTKVVKDWCKNCSTED